MSSDQLVERSPLWKLKDSLSDAQSSTKKMLSKLEKFERRLGNLDTKISRIQTTTENYSRARENITSVLAEVQKTNEYFRVSREVEPAIKAKYANPKALFIGIERLTQAKIFFNAHEKGIKASGQALKTIDGMLKKAIAACCEELERLLSSKKKSAELTDNEDKEIHSTTISPSTIKDAKAICDCLDANNYSEQYGVYERIRSAQVLADLKESNSLNAAAWDDLTQDIPYQKGTHPMRTYAAVVHGLLRNELQLWTSVFEMRSTASMRAYVAICCTIVSEMQATLFPTTSESTKEGAKALKAKPLNDFGSSQINKQSNLFLIRLDLFDIFMNRFEDMRDVCQPNPGQDSDASIEITNIKLRIVQLCTDSVQQLLASTLDSKPAPPTTASNGQSKTAVDDDQHTCDLQPISGNVLYCCKELMSFTSVYKRMHDLVMEMRRTDLSQDAPALTDLVATLLGNVFQTLLKKSLHFDPVGKTRQSRSMNLKGHALFEAGEKDGDEHLLWAKKHLFLSNNLFSLHIYLREKKRDLQAYTVSTGSGPGPGVPGTDIESLRMLLQLADTVEKRLAVEQGSFCETVAGGLSFTSLEMVEFYDIYEETNKTERPRLLKSKFSLFNSGMDALLSQQGEWRVSSSLLREILGTELLQKILPLYKDFFTKYSKVQFSKKHMGEYLRFPPEDVERLLKNFFGKT